MLYARTDYALYALQMLSIPIDFVMYSNVIHVVFVLCCKQHILLLILFCNKVYTICLNTHIVLYCVVHNTFYACCLCTKLYTSCYTKRMFAYYCTLCV